MKKEERKVVKKVWGYEMWLVNNDKYCGKLLLINGGAVCSYHCHKKKQETFYCVEGQVILTVEGKQYDLHMMARPKTIYPGEYHSFYGSEKAIVIEISTHHEESDSYRKTESQKGDGEEWEIW